MKKLLSLLMSVGILLTACSQQSNNAVTTETHKKLKIVTTIFPPADFAKQVGGDLVDVKMLLKPGMESHSYEPTPNDIKAIQEADLFIYAGGENDYWITSIFNANPDKRPDEMKLIDVVPTLEEEYVEGMEHDHDHSHEIHAEDIQDRPLSDFAGQFTSITKYIEDGTLESVLKEHSEEHGETLDEVRTEFLEEYETPYETLTITNDGVEYGDKTVNYTYDGYEALKNEEDDIYSVWYYFKSDVSPKYIAFNDHEVSSESTHGGIAHLHMVFLEDKADFANLIAVPFYIDSNATSEEVTTLMGEGHSHDHEVDEHVWTSPLNAILISQKLSTIFQEKDPENTDVYKTNTEAYVKELMALDSDIREVVNHASRKTLLFGDRFPFRYLANEYGLDYYAAFSGCSTETEASPKTIAFLIEKTNELQLPVVLSIEFSNGKIADSIAESTDAKRMTFHSVHNVSKDELENNETYLSLMRKNIDILKAALN